MIEEKEWQAGMKTHENIIISCYGGLSNTGITSALACSEVEVKRAKEHIIRTILEEYTCS